ncbi:hypothetical protein K438DRAFT_1470821, partial [Mycena galopus ATCC 62051]
MWLKSYLDLGPDRALWAYVADANFAAKVPKSQENVHKTVRINPILQSWKTSSGPLSGIKPELKSLLETAKTFQVRPEGLAFSREILRQMPIFFHREADAGIRRLNNSKPSICLRDKHMVRLVGDAEKIALGRRVRAHQNSAECNCDNCQRCKEELGCADPNECYKKAEQLLDKLPYKWDPRKDQPEDYEYEPEDPENEWVVFDRNITVTGPLANIFRIFTEGDVSNEVADMRLEDGFAEGVTIATDGSCFENGQDNACAGAGIFYAEEDGRNRAIKLPHEMEQSNQTAEMVA